MKEWRLNAVMAAGDLTFENDTFGDGNSGADAWVNASGSGVVGDLDQWAVSAVLEAGKDEIELDGYAVDRDFDTHTYVSG
eukprot:tig00000114_g6026.t1